MNAEKEELEQFANLFKAKEYITTRFNKGLYFDEYKFDYKSILVKLSLDYTKSVESKFRVDLITDEDFRIKYKINVMLVGNGVNDTYHFDIREWTREMKLKELL